MSANNNVNFIGNLGRDPESRHTPSGKLVCNFPLAVSTGYGESKETMWLQVAAWGKSAEYVQKYLRKGDKTAVCGELRLETFAGSNGEQKSAVKVSAESVYALNQSPQSEGQAQPRQGQAPARQPRQSYPEHAQSKAHLDDNEDIPF
jgi:single-strand DNA-binding protein